MNQENSHFDIQSVETLEFGHEDALLMEGLARSLQTRFNNKRAEANRNNDESRKQGGAYEGMRAFEGALNELETYRKLDGNELHEKFIGDTEKYRDLLHQLAFEDYDPSVRKQKKGELRNLRARVELLGVMYHFRSLSQNKDLFQLLMHQLEKGWLDNV